MQHQCVCNVEMVFHKPWLSPDVIMCLKNAMSRVKQNIKRPKARSGNVVFTIVLNYKKTQVQINTLTI